MQLLAVFLCMYNWLSINNLSLSFFLIHLLCIVINFQTSMGASSFTQKRTPWWHCKKPKEIQKHLTWFWVNFSKFWSNFWKVEQIGLISKTATQRPKPNHRHLPSFNGPYIIHLSCCLVLSFPPFSLLRFIFNFHLKLFMPTTFELLH